MAIASMMAFMSEWSTPAVLFCVLNIMIATIFIASNYKSPNHHQHHNTQPSQLTRSPSLLERVKSVNFSSFYTTTESHDHYKPHSETTAYDSASQLSPPLSLLQRVKSIDLSFSSFYNSVPAESEELGNSPSERTRSPSLMDRVKSFKFTSSFNSDQHLEDTTSSKDEDSDIDSHHDLVEDNNVTIAEPHHNKLANLSGTCDVAPTNRSPGKLRKSGSEKKAAASGGGEEDHEPRRPATAKAGARVHDESVDSKADDFINRFKQQLKLQRIDSLKRFREMLHRGT